MHIMKIKRVIALATLLAVACLTGLGYANNYPSTESVEFAKTTNALMLNELKAALFQEFNETTTENVEHGKQAISLIFNDANRDMRLIGAFPQLLGGYNALPSDSFEQRALARSLRGEDLTRSSAWMGVGTTVAHWRSATRFIRRACSATQTSHRNSFSRRITRASGWARSPCGCRSRITDPWA